MTLELRLDQAIQQVLADLVAALEGLSQDQQTLPVIEGEFTIGQMAVLCLQALDTRTCYCQTGERAITWDRAPSLDDPTTWPSVKELTSVAESIGKINTVHLASISATDLLKPSLYAPAQETSAFEAYLYALDYVSAQLRRIWYLRGRLGLEPLPKPVPELATCAPGPISAGVETKTPLQIAIAHYDALEADDQPRWRETLMPQYQQQRTSRGTTPKLWWQVGRGYVDDLSIHYVFDRIDRETARECKVFFKRIQPDNSQRGLPVPITLRKTDDGWRVHSVSY